MTPGQPSSSVWAVSCLQQSGLCLVSSRDLKQESGKEQFSLMSSHLLTVSSAGDFQKQMWFLVYLVASGGFFCMSFKAFKVCYCNSFCAGSS